ncbi:MAG TPA: hypothetical protein VN847_04470 [Streptosporangiaceae bacterium]|nr:hypothetical protein [Streptosporangiaceae bacterium]
MVRSERIPPAPVAAGMMATACPAAMYSSLSSMVSAAGPPGAGRPPGRGSIRHVDGGMTRTGA